MTRIALLCLLAATIAGQQVQETVETASDIRVAVDQVDVFKDDRGVMVNIRYSITNDGCCSIFIPASNLPYPTLMTFDSKNDGIFPYYSIQLYQCRAKKAWYLVGPRVYDVGFTKAEPIRIDSKTTHHGSLMFLQHVASGNSVVVPKQEDFYLIGTHEIRISFFHSLDEWKVSEAQGKAAVDAMMEHKPPLPAQVHATEVTSSTFVIPAYNGGQNHPTK